MCPNFFIHSPVDGVVSHLQFGIFFLVVLGFELMASHLLGRCCMLEPHFQPYSLRAITISTSKCSQVQGFRCKYTFLLCLNPNIEPLGHRACSCPAWVGNCGQFAQAAVLTLVCRSFHPLSWILLHRKLSDGLGL
jgi:hypothetical protein